MDTLVTKATLQFSRDMTASVQENDIEISHEIFYEVFRKRYLEYSMGNYDNDDEFCEALSRSFNAQNVFVDKSHLLGTILARCRPFSDSVPFLERACATWPVILCSNYVHTWALRLLEEHGWTHYFSDILISSTYASRKPGKVIFEKLFEISQVKNRANIVMIGDSISNDVYGATKAGMQAILLHRAGEVAGIESISAPVVADLMSGLDAIARSNQG